MCVFVRVCDARWTNESTGHSQHRNAEESRIERSNHRHHQVLSHVANLREREKTLPLPCRAPAARG